METILYTRLSSEEQADEGNSLEYQKNTLINHCKQNSYTNYKIYEDGGYSTGNTKRPQYQKMIKRIVEKKVKRVIFIKLDG